MNYKSLAIGTGIGAIFSLTLSNFQGSGIIFFLIKSYALGSIFASLYPKDKSDRYSYIVGFALGVTVTSIVLLQYGYRLV